MPIMELSTSACVQTCKTIFDGVNLETFCEFGFPAGPCATGIEHLWSSSRDDWSLHNSSKSSEVGAVGICSTGALSISLGCGCIFLRTLEPVSRAAGRAVVVVVVVAVGMLYVRVLSNGDALDQSVCPWKENDKIYFIAEGL